MARRPRQSNLDHAIWRIRIANECVSGGFGKKLPGPAKAVLMNLAVNIHYDPSNPKRGTTNATTFVGVEKLAATTGYSSDTVGRSIKLLETEKLISRYVRNGNVRKSRLTKLHWDVIVAGRLADLHSDDDADEQTPSFNESPEDDTDWLETSEPTVATTLNGATTQKSAPKPEPKACFAAQSASNTPPTNSTKDIALDLLVRLLQRAFPDHKDFANERSLGYLRQNLQASIDQVGSVALLYDICARLLSHDSARAEATRQKLSESKNLANYLAACLRGDLLERYRNEDPAENGEDYEKDEDSDEDEDSTSGEDSDADDAAEEEFDEEYEDDDFEGRDD